MSWTVDAVVVWCQDWFYKSNKSIAKRLDDLESRVKTLESKPSVDLSKLTAELKAHTDPVETSLKNS